MHSFWRALKFILPYRRPLFLSLASGLVVAFFWGANISAIYPVLTVLLDKHTLGEWVRGKTELQEYAIRELDAEIKILQGQLARGPETLEEKEDLSGRLARKHAQLRSRLKALEWYQWATPLLERFAPRDSFRTLCVLMALLLFGMLFKGFFDYWQEYLSGQVVNLAIFDLRNRFYRQTMALDLSHFDDRGTHDLLARFTSDVESLNNGMRALIGKVLLEPLKALSCLVFACYFNWRLTLLALLLFPVAGTVMGVIGRYLKKVSRKNLESMTRMYKILQESFLGVRVVKAFTMERHERRRFFHENRRFFQQSQKLNRTDAVGGPVLEGLAMIGVSLALLAGSFLVMTESREIFGIRLTYDPLEQSMLLTFYALIAGMCDPLRKVFSVYGRVQRGVAAAERIFHCLDQKPRVVQRPGARVLGRHARSIEFRGVGFGYLPGRPVLRDIDLKVEFGETIAIVGPTGCGKTSLINLLPRFYDATAGAVLIDGAEVRDVTLRSLRLNLGIVTQSTILFDDTIYNNIAYGSDSATPEAVEKAAQAAHAHDFIQQTLHGYQTRIGEMGNSLSGGQRQRIALARAILRDPAILILDEATSSLDVESESLIHEALANFKTGRTTFVVTHRLSTLDIADRIVVIQGGRVEAVGTYEQLLRTSETFQRLHEVHSESLTGRHSGGMLKAKLDAETSIPRRQAS